MFPLWHKGGHLALSGNSRGWHTGSHQEGKETQAGKGGEKKLRKTDLCGSILFIFFLVAFIYFHVLQRLCFVCSLVLSYFGTPFFSAHPRAVSPSRSSSPTLPPSLPLFAQLDLMEQWPNDKNPGEQTHLDSPPAATRDTDTPARYCSPFNTS